MFPQPLIGSAPRIAIATSGFWGTLPIGVFTSPTAWFASKRVLYAPIRVPDVFTVRRFTVGVGAAQSGNVDVGLFSLDGTKLVSTGSTAYAGTNGNVQTFSVTATLIGAGVYWLGVTFDNTTAQINGMTFAAAVLAVVAGMKYEDTGSFGLPATATLNDVVDGFIPQVAMYNTSVG